MSLFHKGQAKKWVGMCPPCAPSSDAPAEVVLGASAEKVWIKRKYPMALDALQSNKIAFVGPCKLLFGVAIIRGV